MTYLRLTLFKMFIAVPDPPENVKWRDRTANSIFLTWDPPKHDGGSRITGYIVEKCPRGSDRWVACGEPVAETKYVFIIIFIFIFIFIIILYK